MKKKLQLWSINVLLFLCFISLLLIASKVRGVQIADDTISRSNMVLGYTDAGSLRAEDIPYDASNSIKDMIDAMSGLSTGDIVYSPSTSKSGFLIMDGTESIGDATSGATKTGATYKSVWDIVWGATRQSVSSGSKGYTILTLGGAPTTRGASAQADWDAHKRIELNWQGVSIVGFDGNGNESEYDVLGESGGAKTQNIQHTHSETFSVDGHILTISQMPAHNHTYQQFPNFGGTSVTYTAGANARAFVVNTGGTGGNGSHNHGMSGSIANSGSTTQNVLNPYAVQNVFIKY